MKTWQPWLGLAGAVVFVACAASPEGSGDPPIYGSPDAADETASGGSGPQGGSGGNAGNSGKGGSAGKAGSGGTGASSGAGGSAGMDAGDGSAGAKDGASDGPAEADGPVNPCMGVVCDKPPAKTCADGTNLKVYNATGTCDAGKCSYSSSLTSCPFGCENNACKNDPCLGVSCNSAPPKTCADGMHLTVFDLPGTCNAGACSYSSHQEYCAFGCENNACKGDPCMGVTCNTPTASFCSDPSHLVVYDVPGTCTNGVCAYSNHEQFCSFGCQSGSCLGDPCAGVTCNTPLAAFCAGANTLRTFDPIGVCDQGVCSYSSQDTNCVYGCINGACLECNTSPECGAGEWCNNHICVACNSDQHCGSSCTNCTTLAQVCSAGSCICPTSTKMCGSCVPISQTQTGCSDTGSCSPCPLPAHATATDCSGAGTTCGFSCDSAEHRIPSGNACVCDSSKKWIEVGGTCQCEAGLVQQGDACVPPCTGTIANGFCYWYVSTPATFAQAEAGCVSQGGHLASITSQVENDTVKTVATATSWFGLHDLGTLQSSTTNGDDCTDIIVANPAGGRYADSTSTGYDDMGPCGKSKNSAVDMFFKLTTTTDWTWAITTTGSNFDTYIGLWSWANNSGYTGCAGTFIACDDDSGPGNTSRIIRNLAAGTYVIVVDGVGGDYGSFNLQLRRFEFTDSTVHNYQNWAADEPSNSSNNEYCAEMYVPAGNWNDLPCTNTLPYVCKKPI